jgi:hypothetical protein
VVPTVEPTPAEIIASTLTIEAEPNAERRR